MNYRIMSKRIVLSVITAAVLGLTGIALAAEFSADVTYTGFDTNEGMTGKLYVKGQMMRKERSGPMGKEVMIVEIDKGIMRMLTPGDKSYIEHKRSDNEPKTELDHLKGMPNIKKTGTENISGYVCDKYTYNDSNNKMSGSAYFSPQLNTTLRLDSQQTVKFNARMIDMKTSYALSNIKEDPQDDSLFIIPPGYRKIASPVVPPNKIGGKPAVHGVKAKQKHPVHKQR